jgi:hypothetical protein
MFRRLWWKEARVFWPLWVALGCSAGLVQWFVLWMNQEQARSGLLIVLGPSWAILYAFAVGAAVFAGEREANTQVFLDTLPASRRMLWTNKVLFALVTTLVLALALTGLGALGTSAYDPNAFPIATIALGHGLMLFEAIVWSLLWSLFVASALQAAVAGIFTVAALWAVLSDTVIWWSPAILRPHVGPHLALAAVALAVSWAVYTPGERPVQSGAVGVRFAGPVLPPQYGRLVWETLRESWRTALLIAGAWIGLLLAAALVPAPDRGLGAIWLVLGILSGTFAGVSVFGPANRTKGYRFYAHHGAGPGSVWATKLLVWGVVMTLMIAVAGVVALIVDGGRGVSADGSDALALCFLIFEAFVLAAFTGHVVRRSITAWVVALLAFFLLVMPQLALYSTSMIPREGLALFPVLVLAVSWAWTRDWMNDLRGPARWLRLAAKVGAAGIVLAASYIGYRAWSVPDVGDPFPPRPVAAPAVLVKPEDDAAPDYARILRELHALNSGEPGMAEGAARPPDAAELDQLTARGWNPNLEPVVKWWQERRGFIDAICAAAAKPEARFNQYGLNQRLPGSAFAGLTTPLFSLLDVDSIERRTRGDLAGAWDDLKAILQMADQPGRSGGGRALRNSLFFRQRALQAALAWAGDPRQTPEVLRKALAGYRALPSPTLTNDLEAEYDRIAGILRDDPDSVIDEIVGEPWKSAPLRSLVLPWWERERALRVLRLMTAQEVRLAELDPWQWTRHDDRADAITGPRKRTGAVPRDRDVDAYLESTPVARVFSAYHTRSFHENILLGRAFVQVAALRIWQLEHGGRYPETLEALVPSLLPSLPPDPYSGRPFRYRPSEGQRLLPLGLSGLTRTIAGETPRSQSTRPGQWLLYSVGPNGRDDSARHNYETNPVESDLIFPLPPS